MINFSRFKSVLWDFDGVLMDSMPVRDKGFERVLSDYPEEQVGQLMRYHRKNGGLSRYVKFRYFFEEIRGERIDDERVQKFAEQFSEVMMQYLVDKKLLIADSIDFVKTYYRTVPMHIVSGSDGNELNEICRQLDIARYFVSIHGSPTPKTKLVNDLITNYAYLRSETVLIGDSINDAQAAQANSIGFLGYNNTELEKDHEHYIRSFAQLTM